MKTTALIKDFCSIGFPGIWMRVHPDDAERVIEFMTLIENCVIRKQTAGGFVTAIVEQDYTRAAFNADSLNFRNIGIYICFRDFLKDHSQ